MNPGYLSWILMCISLIMLASGWKKVMLREISDPALLAFFIAWCVLSRVHAGWPSGIKLNLAVLPLVATIVAVLFVQRSALDRLHLLSIGLFLASIHYLLKHLGEMDPFFLAYRSPAAIALVLGSMTMVLVRKPREQIACLSIALLLGHALHLYMHRERVPVHFGGMAFQDEWWLNVVAARVGTVCVESAVSVLRGAAKNWQERRKGMRK